MKKVLLNEIDENKIVFIFRMPFDTFFFRIYLDADIFLLVSAYLVGWKLV